MMRQIDGLKITLAKYTREPLNQANIGTYIKILRITNSKRPDMEYVNA